MIPMKIRRFILSLAVLLAPFPALAGNGDFRIIPEPQSIEILKGSFKAVGAAVNCDPSFDDGCLAAIRSFSNTLSLASGKMSSFATPVGIISASEKGIVKGFVFIKDNSLKEEEYHISISSRSAIIKATGLNGVLYAIRTLEQMLPEAVKDGIPSPDSDWHLPCAEIRDCPGLSYRGLMLDCSRHFFSAAEVKRVLDIMAAYKLNRFHWHLTDDQGWRIEIKKYPELTLIGGYRDGTVTDDGTSDGIRYGGYYTQEQIKEIVRYASGLGITVIPEISMPGHSQAAVASLPWLGCTEEEVEVSGQWGISEHGICPGKPSSYEFVQNVLEEVMELFPSELIHIGGADIPLQEWKECPDCQDMISRMDGKGLADVFMSGVEAFLKEKGRTAVRWNDGTDAAGDEVLVWSEHITSDRALEDALFPLMPAKGEALWNKR